MGKYLLIILALAGLILSFWALAIRTVAQEDTITFDSPMGEVSFPHSQHNELATCQECHHTLAPNQTPDKCASCHTPASDVNTMTAFHTNCIDCHTNQAKGPTECMDCHKK